MLQVLSTPWAIRPETMKHIVQTCERHLANLDAAVAKAPPHKPAFSTVASEGVAIVPVSGVLMQRPAAFDRWFGAISTQELAAHITQLAHQSAVKAIVLDIDSPGGEVSGTSELAETVRAADAVKPVVAHSSGMMASAAYWVGSAARQVTISGDAVQVGSIGVVAQHVDISGALEARGVRITDIIAGKFKAVTSPHKPLSAEGRDTLQQAVDYLYGVFLGAVAQHRGGSPKSVHERAGDGRLFLGRQGIEAGLVDRIASIETVVGDLTGNAVPVKRVTASAHNHEDKPMDTQLNEHSTDKQIEAVAREQWEADEDLRVEFGGQFHTWHAYLKATTRGHVRVHGRQVTQ